MKYLIVLSLLFGLVGCKDFMPKCNECRIRDSCSDWSIQTCCSFCNPDNIFRDSFITVKKQTTNDIHCVCNDGRNTFLKLPPPEEWRGERE